MIELSFVMKIITINLCCYFGHPLYVNVGTRSRENLGRVRNGLLLRSKKKNIPIIFSKHSLVVSSEAGEIHFFTTQAPVPSKTFLRLLVRSKAAGSGGSGSDSGSAFLFATVGGMRPITFRK